MPSIISQLEYHVVDACNMACEFCSHYSNFKGPANLLSVEQAKLEWAEWSLKVNPNRFHVIGGEPLLNPKISEIILAAFEIWSTSTIVLYSNGLLIHKHPKLRDALSGGRFALGLHFCDERDSKIEANVREFFSGSNVDIDVIDGSQGWMQFYRFSRDGTPVPYTDDLQRKSWENCVAAQQRCFVLRDNKLWKCPQIAFADRAGIDWFSGYSPCDLGSDIEKWISLEDEPCCKNCPATKQFTSHGAKFMNSRLPIVELPGTISAPTT